MVEEIIKGGNRRRTDNTMAKRKRTKAQIIIFKILHRELKIEQNEPHLKLELRCSERVNSSCSTCGTRRVTLCYKPGDKS
jgi:hypothetical protein